MDAENNQYYQNDDNNIKNNYFYRVRDPNVETI
jgi:hypothetical protein